jgi:hypothetical protein
MYPATSGVSGYLKYNHRLFEQYGTLDMSPRQGYWGDYAVHDPVYIEEREKEECRSSE